jgi:hypothetical protein
MESQHTDFERYFGFLETRFGFTLVSYTEEPLSYGNFTAVFRKGTVEIRLVRDRFQVFVDFVVSGGTPMDKEVLLRRLGVPFDRFPTEEHFWLGYQIHNQSADLERYLPFILETLTSKQ